MIVSGADVLLYDLEHMETIIVEHTRYRVFVDGHLLGEIVIEATGDDRRWLAIGVVGYFASQAEAIAALAERSGREVLVSPR